MTQKYCYRKNRKKTCVIKSVGLQNTKQSLVDKECLQNKRKYKITKPSSIYAFLYQYSCFKEQIPFSIPCAGGAAAAFAAFWAIRKHISAD